MSSSIPNTRSDTPITLYDACLAEAAAGGRALMDSMVSQSRLSLQQAAAMAGNGPEREAIAESLRILSKHEAPLGGAYASALQEAFAGGAPAESARVPAGAPGPSFDQLELMDESQVQESVELARAQQAAVLAVEGPLAEFHALICAAQGLKTVQADCNPLRPEVYVRVLRDVLVRSGAPTIARLRWMPHFGAALGRELSNTYAMLSARLRQGGVTAAGYVVTQVASAGPRRAAAAAPAAADRATSASREETRLTMNQLHRLLAGQFDGAAPGEAKAASPSRADFNVTVPAAFEVLQELKQVDQVMKRLAGRNDRPEAAGTPAPPLSLLRQQLHTDARGVGQALGLEVVNLMVENIAADPRLLEPVRKAVRGLEPALLRLAMIDPRFFSDKRHPARRLLEQMTQRSLAWQDAAAPGFQAFMEPLEQVVQVLGTIPIEGAEPFEFAVKSLLEAWGEQQRLERSVRGAAVQSLLHAEQRNMLAAKLAQEIRTREDARSATPEMMAFLTGAWAQVLAQARLNNTSGAADPGGYTAAINDLLWSAQPALARHSIPRLARLVPTLLATLRQGLASIEYPLEKTTAFFDGLMVLHQQGLRPEGASLSSVAAGAAVDPDAGSQPRKATRAELEALFATQETEPWIAPAEARQSGFMPTDLLEESTASSQPQFEPTQAGFAETQAYESRPARLSPSGKAAATEELLPVGAWVDFVVGDRATRTQLSWASPHGTLFMFTNAEGAAHSMTRGSVERLLAEGGIRVVADHHAVVEGALDAVARAAMENSLDISF
ncbi:MAG: DUF1631 family protein [Comamonadaceae bacterium]|nr:MAG: DUF1631 family protein [Comamonadaceae bacterium]